MYFFIKTTVYIFDGLFFFQRNYANPSRAGEGVFFFERK